jgi:hypothetical protein
LVARHQMENFQYSYKTGETDGEGRQEDMKGYNPHELQAGEEDRIEMHHNVLF